MRNTQEQNKGLNLIAAGIAGAIIGAGAGVVAVVAMRDEKTQKHIKNISLTFYDQIKDYVRKANTHTTAPTKNAIKKLSVGKK